MESGGFGLAAGRAGPAEDRPGQRGGDRREHRAIVDAMVEGNHREARKIVSGHLARLPIRPAYCACSTTTQGSSSSRRQRWV
jgi:hypothetical protein